MKIKKLFLSLTAIAVIIMIGGCSLSDSLSDEEKAVLVNKAIAGAGTSTTSSGSPARTISGGSMEVTAGSASDFTGSQFAGEVSGSQYFYSITYSNVSVTVQDEDGNNVTVVLNGNMNYAYKIDGTTFTYYFYGTVSGTVDGEDFSFSVDLKTTMASDGTSYSVTVTGTAGGVEINETYSASGTTP